MLRPCLGGCGTLVEKSRCKTCQRPVSAVYDRTKREHRPERTWEERKRREGVVASWRERVGDWCPGWGSIEGHPSKDLTAAHLYSVASGADEAGPLGVLCRSCNAAMGKNSI